MGSQLGGTTRLYAFYILFSIMLMGLVAVFSSDSPAAESHKSGFPGEEIPMNVFIRSSDCSGSLGDVVIQSWNYNDYSLPGVSLEISGIGKFETDINGILSLRNLSNGEYYVFASKENHETKSFDFTVSCPIRKTVIRPQN